MNVLFRLLPYCAVTLFLQGALYSQCEQIVTPDPATSIAVAVSGATLAVGNPGDDVNGPNSGAVRLHRALAFEWVDGPTLAASDGAAGDNFGHAVDVDASVIVVGAPEDDPAGLSSGSAYVFRFDGSAWQEEAKLAPSDGTSLSRFGRAVSIAGDLVVVGSPGDDQAGDDAGAAYVFRFDGAVWQEEQKLVASSPFIDGLFGDAVAVVGDTLMVGAAASQDHGVVHAYEWTGVEWVETQQLSPPDGTTNDLFGFSVSLHGARVAVGARNDDDLGPSAGSAYVYERIGSQWLLEQKLVASDGAAADFFGYSVSIGDDALVVGALQHDETGDNAGAAYCFRLVGGSWLEDQKLQSSAAYPFARYGASVDLSGHVIAVGGIGDSDSGVPGSAHIYSQACELFVRGDCNDDGVVTGLGDGLAALNFQFIPGTSPPPCLRACDADGDDRFNGLSDGLALLNFQFAPGTPPPPSPYPDPGSVLSSGVSCETALAAPSP